MTTAGDALPDTSWRPGAPEVALLATLAVGVTALYLVGQVWPAWHNGFLGQPYDQWSLGQQDPKDVWPAGTPVDGLVSTAGTLCVLLLVPLAPLLTGLGSAVVAVTTARQGRPVLATVSWVVFGLSAALAAFAVSPLGLALHSWRLD